MGHGLEADMVCITYLHATGKGFSVLTGFAKSGRRGAGGVGVGAMGGNKTKRATIHEART